MQYLILIYNDETPPPNVPPEVQQREMQRWFDLTAAMRSAGVYVAGEALQPVSTATTVRTEGGKLVTTDGPFAETKEQLGGFYMIDVENLDEALKWARRLPSVETGSVEVRPIMALPQP